MSIDEAIAHAREISDKKSDCWKRCINDTSCSVCEKKHEQLAEWLEELKALKNGLNIKCDKLNEALEKGKKIGYNKAIDDFSERIIRYVDCGHLCSPTEMRWSDLSIVEMVKKLAEQLKAGVSNGTD